MPVAVLVAAPAALAAVLAVAAAQCATLDTIVIDGTLTDAPYVLVDDDSGGPGAGFGPTNEFKALYIATEAGCDDVYFGVQTTLESGGANQITFFVDSDPAVGASSSDIAGSTVNTPIDHEVFFAMTNPTSVFLVDRIDGGQSGAVTDAAFVDSQGTQTGFEFKVTKSQLLMSGDSLSLFAMLHSATGFWSNRFIPPIDSGAENIGFCDSSVCDFSSYAVATLDVATFSFTQSASETHSATESVTASHSHSADPGGVVGDPILVDFAGHRFMGGARGNTDYLLYASADGSETMVMTTGFEQGNEDGFFARSITTQRAGCGTIRFAANQVAEHKIDVEGDACMVSQVAMGDEPGTAVFSMRNGGAVVAIHAHHSANSAAFVNLKVMASSEAFRAGCTGMLCDETHADAEV